MAERKHSWYSMFPASSLTGYEVPGKRYALTLQVMLKRFRKRKSTSSSRSPKTARDPHRSMPMVADQSLPYSPIYEQQPQYPADHNMQQQAHMSQPQAPGPLPNQHHHLYATDAEHIWRGFEMTSNEQLPVWISDQTLGGNSFSQNGMDAFLLPNDYLPPAPQIW